MKSKAFLTVFAVLLFFGACRKSESTTTSEIPQIPESSQLDNFIKSKLQTEGQFLWAWASNEQIWSALTNSDHILAVGYKPQGEMNVENRLHEIDIKSAPWTNAKEGILALVLEQERKLNPSLTLDQLIAYNEEILPVLDLRINNPNSVTLLRKSGWVRYAEPMSYEPKFAATERSDSGCDGNPAETITAADYTVITPTSKSSWNHPYHKITQAWANSTGAGCKIMYVDTGVSDAQENLGAAFNQGSSTGRTITKLVTLPQSTNWLGFTNGPVETPNDLCGHGTSMIGAGTAPRGTDGTPAGIAYNANVVSVRAAQDVYLDESREVKGVSDAFTLAGNTASVKIISMSMGCLTSNSQISDAVKYAYGKGKMIFCAAGTSFSWATWFVGVIFPASMTEAIAVTGIQDNLIDECEVCHTGSKVDFVVVMEKTSDLHSPLTLANSGDAAGMVGGSSVATSSTAAMAALVWSKYPTWTRLQVFNRLKTSSNYYPTRNSNFGWGRINAQLATN